MGMGASLLPPWILKKNRRAKTMIGESVWCMNLGQIWSQSSFVDSG